MQNLDAKRAARRGYKLRWKLLMERVTEGMDITRRHLALLLILLVVGISASVMTFVVVKGWEHSRTQADFDRRLNQAMTALNRSVDVDLSILDSVAGLQSVAQGVSKAEFESMTSLGWSRQTGIQALAWAPKVSLYERETYENQAQRQGLAGYRIHEYTAEGHVAPVSERPDYFPVYYLEPLAGNAPLLGLDLKSQPTYQIAMAQARDTGRATATRRILLETVDGTRNAFIVLTPVYRGGGAGLGLQQRRERLKGFSVGVFLVDDLVRTALTHLDDLITVSLIDDSDDAREEHRALYGELPVTPDRSDPSTRLATTRAIEIGGRAWTLHARPTAQYLHSQRTWQAEGLLVAGLQFVALLDAYLLLVFGRTAQVERLVNQRTSQLMKTNHDLKREIIQRKATERALRNGEERIKSILDGAAGLIDLNDASSGSSQAGAWLSAPDGTPATRLQLSMSETGGGDDQAALPLATIVGEGAATRGGGDVTVLRGDGSDPSEQLVGKVSRDLRSPLSSMLFAAKILAKHRTLGPDKVAKFADIVVNEGRRLTGLINQALDLSTLEAARGRALTIAPVEAETLLEGLATAVEAYAGRKEIKLTIMADEDVQPVMADNTRVEQVLINLAENAIKFTPARGEVRVIVTRQNANYVRFSVSDSGVGMSVTEQEKAFDAFSQDADVLKTASEGSGFGLASCKEIVERHGGTIWVDSQVGVGSTFSFTLPVVNKRQAKLEHCA